MEKNMTNFLAVVVIFLLLGTSSSSSIFDDFRALITLKQHVQKADPVLESWNAEDFGSVCFWVGIRCRHGRVATVDLSNMNFSGAFPSACVRGLDQLVELSLAGNNFSGDIVIGNVTNLRYINISGNQFSGNLNWDYSTLQNLEMFDAYDNSFKAPLPVGIPSLKKLKYLDLAGNFFHGGIPPSYGELAELEYVSFAGNDLRGRIPGELGNLTNLKEVYLGYFNSFSGGIPRELGNLINLLHMDLSNCYLDGEIPEELGNLISMDTLYLHTNLLSGSMPENLGNLTSIINMDLSNNKLSGRIPPEFSGLRWMKLLNLFMNRLYGPIPGFFSEMENLETLGLWRNNFTGEIPSGLGKGGRMQVLDLSSNKLTGVIPSQLCPSNRLKVLILLKNFLFGPIPESLGKCFSLVRVRLGQNYLNGSIPDGFIFLPELNLVELQENYLTGELKENTLGAYRPEKMEEINLSNNLLSGRLPSSISNFSSLQNLILGSNRFSGTIPATFGQLGQIVKLDLSKNSLSGEIPVEISGCFHLTFLDLSQNNFSGSIPDEISNIHILNYLNLSRNWFNDSIPKSIGSMKSLTNADFSFNLLSGKVPELGQFVFFNASSYSGNPDLCGSLIGTACNVSITQIATKKSQKKDLKLFFALGLLISSLIFVAAAITKTKSSKKGRTCPWTMTAFQRVEFTASDVLECMKDGNVIGRGGAGVVYHGKMPSGMEIAVKRLLGFAENSHDHGFRAEIETLGKIRHRNIVRLLAFCTNKETNLLVYEYMKNGSLGEALHGKHGGFLGWNLRYNIAMEAARGLCYLHHDCSPLIVHRDVKSNNILLNSLFEAHVADFGLAKYLIVDGCSSHCMSAVAGSYGYIAPEYAYTLKVDEKSDVYSFGVVLLELITGRRPVGGFDEGVDIVQWMKRIVSSGTEDLPNIVDRRMVMVPPNEVKQVLFISMLCLREDSVERPTMREVIQMLSESRQKTSGKQTASPPAINSRDLMNMIGHSCLGGHSVHTPGCKPGFNS